MILHKIKPEQLESQELTVLVRRVKNLVRTSYSEYEKNYKTLSVLLKKIMKLSKEEKEWHVYFRAMHDLIYADIRISNYKEIVQLAEVYYKDSALYMDSAIPNYPGMNMALLNVWICGDIFLAYSCYYQIDDAKMELFMQRYEETARKYGHLYEYDEDEMRLAYYYHDTDRARAAARRFLKHRTEIDGCYVCAHNDYLKQLVQTNQDKQAEALMLDFIHKNIPKQHVWCYKYCERAQTAALYATVLGACIWNAKKDTFDMFYEKYWRTLPKENQRNEDADSFDRLLCVFGGFVEGYEDDLRQAAEDIGEQQEQKDTTLDDMDNSLNWWCYFTLLDRNGVHTVPITLPGLNTDENGQVSTLAVSAYMEERADLFGGQLAQARAAFDYAFIKAAHQKCLL